MVVMDMHNDYMTPEQFNKLLTLILNDECFRNELRRDGFGALERLGIKVDMPPEIRSNIARLTGRPGSTSYEECGLCGVCTACGLCGPTAAIGASSAALWSTFSIFGLTTGTASRP